jgi:hypothetical protein
LSYLKAQRAKSFQPPPSNHREAAFYEGKVLGARYYIKNILPRAEALAKWIKSEDLSLMALPVNGF